MAFMPPFAPVAALAFLALFGLTGSGVIAVVVLAATGRIGLARRVLVPVLGIAALYVGVEAAVALAGEEVVLGPGQSKVFCELDCHLAYAVSGVDVVSRLERGGTEASPANGSFWVVTLRTTFDERTISPARPADAPLWPGPRLVYLEDEAGRRWLPDESLSAYAGDSVPLSRELRPGESYETRLVFDVPASSHARLMVTDAAFPVQLMIGHERSWLHPDVWFGLTPVPRTASRDATTSRGQPITPKPAS